MKIISLANYVNEYHEDNFAQAARSLTNYSTKKAMSHSAIFVNSKSDAFIVIIEDDKHMLCKIAATSHTNTSVNSEK